MYTIYLSKYFYTLVFYVITHNLRILFHLMLQKNIECMQAYHSQYYYWGLAYLSGGTLQQYLVSHCPIPELMNCRNWTLELPQRLLSRHSHTIAPSCSLMRSGEHLQTLVSKNKMRRM